jgi:hypothetical protein
MKREEEFTNMEGCSVHVDQEIQHPSKHKGLRDHGGEGSHCPPETGVHLSEGRCKVGALCSYTSLVTCPISSINSESLIFTFT